MKTLFLDANILFAATLSETGASRVLFLLAQKKKIKIVSSHYALEEAKRNIELKIGKEKLPEFFKLCSELSKLETTWTKPVEPLEEWHKEKRKELEEQNKWVQKYKAIIVEKDIPILYSAQKLKVNILVTLDRKDFMSKQMKATKFSFQILTPGEFLQSL